MAKVISQLFQMPELKILNYVVVENYISKNLPHITSNEKYASKEDESEIYDIVDYLNRNKIFIHVNRNIFLILT